MPHPAPSVLGRGVVVDAGDPVPSAWVGAPEVVVDAAALDDPSGVVGSLHAAWGGRQAVVVRLAVDPAVFREPRGYAVEPWTVSPGFEAWHDRLHFLVWANTFDARGGRDPVWWWARKAARLGARPVDDGDGDVVLPDGSRAWVDGGPRGALPGLSHAVVHRESVEAGVLTCDPAPGAPPTLDLAPDQRAAVLHGAGPARIIAPAGSGKTRVLIERMRHLITHRGLDRDTTVGVAYNRRAQGELRERGARFAPRVETLNALGYELLGRALGGRPPVLDEREVRRIVEGLVPARRRRANTDPIGPYLEAFSLARLGLIDPAVVEDTRDDVEGFAEAFAPYRAELRRRGAVDFDEQVYGAVEVLLADGAFRRAQQARHRRLLVDEFQDLTPAHLLMIRLLATPELDVFGVGDDDQVIYGHAGADPAFLIHFDRYFPGAGDHPLTVNYRCPITVVNAAVTLLGYNTRRVPKRISAGPDADSAPDALQVRLEPGDRGAAALVEVVREWMAGGVAPADIAVLTRVNALLMAPQVALSDAGVPVDSVLDPGVLSRTGARAALAYLRIATNPGGFAAEDVVEVLRRPSRGFPIWVERWFRSGALRVDGVRAIARRMDDARVAAKVESLADDLQAVIDAAAGGTTREVLRTVREVVGLEGAMALLDASGATTASHLDDLEALEQVAGLHPDPAGFEAWLRAHLGGERTPGGVTLSTVHRVKGREWGCVAVYGVTDGVFPHRLAGDREEERRVMHVAITRGIRRVVVLGDQRRVSPFIGEMAGTAAHDVAPARAPAAPAPARPRRPSGAPAPADEPPLEGAALVRETALRAWRSTRATRDGVPAYVVLHDRHLRGVARRNPATAAELARCDGMGPTRMERYGDELLGVLSEC